MFLCVYARCHISVTLGWHSHCMKNMTIALCLLIIAGCTGTAAPSFSWYHPLGGEYLFEFDQKACEEQVILDGQVLGSDPEGPFFRCMEERGYSLITARLISEEVLTWSNLVSRDL